MCVGVVACVLMLMHVYVDVACVAVYRRQCREKSLYVFELGRKAIDPIITLDVVACVRRCCCMCVGVVACVLMLLHVG